MGLTSKPTLDVIQRLFDKFFDLNSLLDRHVYLLDIKFNLPKYQDYVHHSISHEMPLFADKIQEFGSLRGDMLYRGIVPEHREDYNKVQDLTESYVLALGDVEKLCGEAINTAISQGDLMYEDYIRSFEVDVVAPLIKQATVFYRAIKDYEDRNELYKWNKDFSSYIIGKDGD